MTEFLDIVDENDEVIGRVEREEARMRKLSGRRVFILFYNPQGEVFLQRRSLKKKTSPGLLTTTVGGHVESGATYDETMIKEGREESGIAIDEDRVIKLGKRYYSSPDGMLWVSLYLYPFDGSISDLTIEPDEADGFERIEATVLRQQLSEKPELFSPILYNSPGQEMLDEIIRRTTA